MLRRGKLHVVDWCCFPASDFSAVIVDVCTAWYGAREWTSREKIIAHEMVSRAHYIDNFLHAFFGVYFVYDLHVR